MNQDISGSLSSQPTEMLSERVARSTVGQRRRFSSGSIPNAGSFRRREMLNGSVRSRYVADMRGYLEARRAMRESAAREPNEIDCRDKW